MKYGALTCPKTGDIIACCTIKGEGDKDVIDDRRILQSEDSVEDNETSSIETGNALEELIQLSQNN